MSERWHWPVLNQPHATVALSPIRQPTETKFGPPAEPARDRRKADFKSTTRPRLSADVIDQHDLPTRPNDARELVERCFGLRHCRDDELCHDDVEGPIRQRHALGIHYCQRLDIGQSLLGYAFVRSAQHRFRQIDTNEPVSARVFRKRNAGAHTDLEDAPAGRPAGLLGGFD